SWRRVKRLQPHIIWAETVRVLLGRTQSLIELYFRFDFNAATGSEHLRQSMVIPYQKVIVRAVVNMAFRPVPAIVQYDNDGIEVVTHRSGEFHSRHLKRSVADQHQWAQSGIGKLCPNPGRHGETHRSVVGRAKELGPVMNEQV